MRNLLRKKNNKKAFTLIELLVVITIIVILAAVAIASFGNTNNRAKLDFFADSVVSEFKKVISLTKAGKVTSTTETAGNAVENVNCYGFHIATLNGSTPSAINTLVIPYVAYKQEVGQTYVDYCDVASPKVLETEFNGSKQFLISDLKKGDTSIQVVYIVFKPPLANPFVIQNLNDFPKSYTENSLQQLSDDLQNRLEFNISSALGDSKKIVFNPQTLILEKLNE